MAGRREASNYLGRHLPNPIQSNPIYTRDKNVRPCITTHHHHHHHQCLNASRSIVLRTHTHRNHSLQYLVSRILARSDGKHDGRALHIPSLGTPLFTCLPVQPLVYLATCTNNQKKTCQVEFIFLVVVCQISSPNHTIPWMGFVCATSVRATLIGNLHSTKTVRVGLLGIVVPPAVRNPLNAWIWVWVWGIRQLSRAGILSSHSMSCDGYISKSAHSRSHGSCVTRNCGSAIPSRRQRHLVLVLAVQSISTPSRLPPFYAR